MRKIIFLLIYIFLFSNCSFDNKTGIWTGSDKIVKKEKNENSNIEFVFKKQKNVINEKELSSKEIINLDNPKLFSEWAQSYQNKYNNLGNILYLNEGNYKKFSKISRVGINENILVHENNLIFSDYKGNIRVFSLDENQLIFDFNFYKNKIKKTKKEIKLIAKNNFIIAADNFGYIYSINYKNNKINWAKNFLVPFRSNLKIIDNVLFLSDEKNKIIMIDINNGNKIDELYTQPSKTVSGFESSLALDEKNNLLFLSTSGTLYSLNLVNNKVINWIQNFKNENQIIFDGKPIIVLKDSIIISTGKSISLLQQNGSRIWDLSIKSNVRPAASGNIIFLVSTDNQLVFINKNSGQIVYSKNINSLIANDFKKSFSKKIKKITHIFLVNNKLLLITNDSHFVELNLKNLISINSIKKNPFKISSNIVFVNKEMVFISENKRIFKVN